MNNIKMYTSQFCPYCSNAESLLKSKGYEISEKIYVDQDPEVLSKMIEMTGKRTVPQIFINDKYIGGFDELRKLDNTGDLDKVLNI
ncbi:MAG: glutaredoxin 3 [Methylophilaceae bacterium]|jgi:glutaredoxin 3|nr:glutaredoxin 3 [Methylophilaceae bacterium]